MIRSKKQYKMTKKWLLKFMAGATILLEQKEHINIHPLILKAQLDAIQNQIEIFTEELSEWERSKVYSKEEVIAFMAATANHVRVKGYGGCSISHHLATILYEDWSKKE